MKYEKIYSTYENTKELINIKATRDDSSVIFIPVDEGNVDYQQYLKDTKKK